MPELRKHYFLDHWVIISEKRGKRPDLNKKTASINKNKAIDKTCFFCMGNENLTPPEIYSIKKNNKWLIRVVNNPFPAVETKIRNKIQLKKSSLSPLLNSKTAYGYHEVIIDSNKHNKNLEDYPKEHLKQLFDVFIKRIAKISKEKNIGYVGIFKNHKKEAGASIPHSHCQLIAYNEFPEKISEEIKTSKKFKSCIYCKILAMESKSPRLCFKNKTFIAFAPFASQFPYEITFLPKRHASSIIDLNSKELADLADLLKKTLQKLKKLDAAYNFYLHNFPENKKYHFHLKITPRITTLGGFELETGTIINTILPENAAKFYKK
ncbi:galactose-1-phosphate uridylyltransferase [Candidatus Woesearchaeota archaeon]|nr:galactose-1-phosphate uridylyltransferase [Candidatus Woesearchaeota archaeon]